MILFTAVSVPSLAIPLPIPATPVVELPLIVELCNVRTLMASVFEIPAPAPSDAEFPLMVELLIVSVL